jgi:cation transporter-like permease
VGFVLLFPIAAVRSFFALRLPTEILAATLLIGIAGMALMITVWMVSRRLGADPDAIVLAGGG